MLFRLLNVAVVNAYTLHSEWSANSCTRKLSQAAFCTAVIKQMIESACPNLVPPCHGRRSSSALELQQLPP